MLRAIETCAAEVRLSVLPELLSVAARGVEFAGWLFRDAHDASQARTWYSKATEYAQEANDTAMQGYVLLKKSQLAYDERDTRHVLTLAQAAQYGPWLLSGYIRAEVTQQEARGLAMVGKPLAIVEQKLDDARILFSGAIDKDRHTQLGSPYSEDTLTLRDASCYLEVGRPHQAAVLYQRVLSADVLSRRDRGYYMARLTSSLALAGEPDEAAGAGLGSIPDPRNHCSDDERLPFLTLWVGVLRIIVDSEAVLRPLDLNQLMHGCQVRDRCSGTLDRHERVLGAVHDQRRRCDLAKHGKRADPEDLVKKCPTLPHRWRVLEVAGLTQLLGSVIVETIIVPIWFLTDVPILVLQLRVQEDQPRQLIRPFRGVVGTQSPAEAGTEQADHRCASQPASFRERNANVVQVRSQGAVLLTSLTLPVPAKIETEGGSSRFTEAIGQPGKEAALFTCDPAAVDEDDRVFSLTAW
jgi:hypothetical protein